MLSSTNITHHTLNKQPLKPTPGDRAADTAASTSSGPTASKKNVAAEERIRTARFARAEPPGETLEAQDQATISEKAKQEQAAENQALNDLDQHGDLFDNPGGGRKDGIISSGNLKTFAEGNFNRDAAREHLQDQGVPEGELDATLDRLSESARYLLDNESVLNSLDVANDKKGKTDGKISRGDISREVFQRQLEQARNGELPAGPSASNRGGYEPTVTTRNSERPPAVIAQQELAILEGVNSGQPVSFTNSNGQTEELTVRQVTNTGGNTAYELTGADGHTMRIESELGASQNRTALARLADYYTQIPEHLRDPVNKVEFRSKPDNSAAARFYSASDRIVFYDGLKHLNEEVFNHEFGHGIGFEKDGLGEGALDYVGRLFTGWKGEGTPKGWTEAIQADPSKRISEYAHTDKMEDFAESWAAYMEATDNGPAALATLEEAYPARYAIMEELYNGA